MKTEDIDIKPEDLPALIAGARVAAVSSLDQFIADILAPNPVDEGAEKPHIE